MADLLAELSKNYGPVLSAGAVLVSATAALLAALYTISTNRALARKKATLDLIIKSETDEYFLKLTKTYTSIRDGEGGVNGAIAPLEKLFARRRKQPGDEPIVVTDDEVTLVKTVQSYLNYYELIAIGIDNKILDEKFYQDWMRSGFVDAWLTGEPVIRRWRELGSYELYFIRMQYYACKWNLPRYKRVMVHWNIVGLGYFDHTYPNIKLPLPVTPPVPADRMAES